MRLPCRVLVDLEIKFGIVFLAKMLNRDPFPLKLRVIPPLAAALVIMVILERFSLIKKAEGGFDHWSTVSYTIYYAVLVPSFAVILMVYQFFFALPFLRWIKMAKWTGSLERLRYLAGVNVLGIGIMMLVWSVVTIDLIKGIFLWAMPVVTVAAILTLLLDKKKG
jgi:hypothetical protein